MSDCKCYFVRSEERYMGSIEGLDECNRCSSTTTLCFWFYRHMPVDLQDVSTNRGVIGRVYLEESLRRSCFHIVEMICVDIMHPRGEYPAFPTLEVSTKFLGPGGKFWDVFALHGFEYAMQLLTQKLRYGRAAMPNSIQDESNDSRGGVRTRRKYPQTSVGLRTGLRLHGDPSQSCGISSGSAGAPLA